MAIVIKKKPVFINEKKDVKQGLNSFSIPLSKLNPNDSKLIKNILLKYLKQNYVPAQKAKSITIDPTDGYYNETSLNGYYSSNREETDSEFQKRKEKYEKDIDTYNRWLKNNRDKVQKSLEDRKKELEEIQRDLEGMVLVEQYTN